VDEAGVNPAIMDMPDPFGDDETREPIEVIPPLAPLVVAPTPTVTDNDAGTSAGAICWAI
jgi:hypothetical protein